MCVCVSERERAVCVCVCVSERERGPRVQVRGGESLTAICLTPSREAEAGPDDSRDRETRRQRLCLSGVLWVTRNCYQVFIPSHRICVIECQVYRLI